MLTYLRNPIDYTVRHDGEGLSTKTFKKNELSVGIKNFFKQIGRTYYILKLFLRQITCFQEVVWYITNIPSSYLSNLFS